MPLEDRAPIILRDIASCSYQEVADALDLPLDATKSRIHRARMRLRDQVEARYDVNSLGRPAALKFRPTHDERVQIEALFRRDCAHHVWLQPQPVWLQPQPRCLYDSKQEVFGGCH